MHQTQNQGRAAGTPFDTLKLQKVQDSFCNVYLRLASPDRRKVSRLLERLAYRKTGTNSYWDRWTTDDVQACYLQLRLISQEIASGWRRWASAHLKTGLNCRLVIIVLVDVLVCRMWLEESSADSDR